MIIRRVKKKKKNVDRQSVELLSYGMNFTDVKSIYLYSSIILDKKKTNISYQKKKQNWGFLSR